jgi:hypothetical protein
MKSEHVIVSVDADLVSGPQDDEERHSDGRSASSPHVVPKTFTETVAEIYTKKFAAMPRSRSVSDMGRDPSDPSQKQNWPGAAFSSSGKWSSKTMEYPSRTLDDLLPEPPGTKEGAERNQHPSRFGFSGLASAAGGAASLAHTASSQMSALKKRVTSRIQVLRWLRNDADEERLDSYSATEEVQHTVYGGTLTFPLVSIHTGYCRAAQKYGSPLSLKILFSFFSSTSMCCI